MPDWISPWELVGFDEDFGLWGYEIGGWVKIIYFCKSQGDLILEQGYIVVTGGVKGGKDIVNTVC